jgi:hypothetical protein
MNPSSAPDYFPDLRLSVSRKHTATHARRIERIFVFGMPH